MALSPKILFIGLRRLAIIFCFLFSIPQLYAQASFDVESILPTEPPVFRWLDTKLQTNLTQINSVTSSDWHGDNDGYPEPGEFVTVRLYVANHTGQIARNIRVDLVGGGSVRFGDLYSGFARSGDIPITLPVNAPCGGDLLLRFNVTSSLGDITFDRSLLIGKPRSTITFEGFDDVSAPAFPSLWAVASTTNEISFVTAATGDDPGSNTAQVNSPAGVSGGSDLTSPPIFVNDRGSSVSFRSRIDTEYARTGASLEISIANGEYRDFLDAGGRFIVNGYNSTLAAAASNPLGGRYAWSGNSGGFATTIARFPAEASGKTVRLRFRFGADQNAASGSWSIDSLTLERSSIVSAFSCSLLSDLRSKSDFDSDGKSDFAIYRPGDQTFWIHRTTLGPMVQQIGQPGAVPAVADYDGDGKTDIAVFDPANGDWLWISSEDAATRTYRVGRQGDIPQPADMDGDGRDDPVVYSPSDRVWTWRRSSDGVIAKVGFGEPGDIPTMGDYDGDGKGDLSVFRPLAGVWSRINSGDQAFVNEYFGLSIDIPANGDYDGDGKDDLGVFRPGSGSWYYMSSLRGVMISWDLGVSSDIPVAGDFDGNGTDDLAVYRNGEWHIDHLNNSTSFFSYGLPTDIPVTEQPFPFYVFQP